ncbi:MAG: polyprenyl synthetase family protein, partial [Muribaculaceae bacterium]|nr:polyprenyl synthetase family protein [Muribaculaceae bacterium]
MKNISSIQASIAPELKRLNDRIADTLHSSNPLMNRVIDNYLQTKGKQIRPILVILSAKIFGSVDENVISAAAAVELLHNASLIHDDVVD